MYETILPKSSRKNIAGSMQEFFDNNDETTWDIYSLKSHNITTYETLVQVAKQKKASIDELLQVLSPKGIQYLSLPKRKYIVSKLLTLMHILKERGETSWHIYKIRELPGFRHFDTEIREYYNNASDTRERFVIDFKRYITVPFVKGTDLKQRRKENNINETKERLETALKSLMIDLQATKETYRNTSKIRKTHGHGIEKMINKLYSSLGEKKWDAFKNYYKQFFTVPFVQRERLRIASIKQAMPTFISYLNHADITLVTPGIIDAYDSALYAQVLREYKSNWLAFIEAHPGIVTPTRKFTHKGADKNSEMRRARITHMLIETIKTLKENHTGKKFSRSPQSIFDAKGTLRNQLADEFGYPEGGIAWGYLIQYVVPKELSTGFETILLDVKADLADSHNYKQIDIDFQDPLKSSSKPLNDTTWNPENTLIEKQEHDTGRQLLLTLYTSNYLNEEHKKSLAQVLAGNDIATKAQQSLAKHISAYMKENNIDASEYR